MSYGQLPPGPVNPHLIDAMLAGSQRSLQKAYLFWYFAGAIGIHNFYLGKPVLGSLQAASLPLMMVMAALAKWIGIESVAGLAAAIIGAGILGLLALSLVIDPFLIPARARAYTERLRAELEAEADWQTA